MSNTVDAAMTARVDSVRGYSAYEIALQHGYVGTEEQWLASLVGTTVTVNGKSHDQNNNITVGAEDIAYSEDEDVGEAIEGLAEDVDGLEDDVAALQTAVNGKLSTSNVYNALDKTAAGFALDARQGKALNDALALKASASDLTALQSTVAGKCSVAQKTITLPTTGWNESGYITILCDGVTAENCVIVRPAPSSNTDWVNAGMLCVGQAAGMLHFMRTTANTNAINVNVAIFG